MKMTNKIAISAITVMALSMDAYATCASDVDMGVNKITSSAVPSGANDLTNKAYVDSVVANPPVVAPAGYEVIYVNGVAWLDRNLGATTACTTVDGDTTCHGDLYQWGRPADGHQLRTSGTQSGQTLFSQPNHGDFILVGADDTNNWVYEYIQYFWSVPGNGAIGVCPAGWSVPTEKDFIDLSLINSADAFTKLKLTESGYRYNVGGTGFSDSGGRYWSATVYGGLSRYLSLTSGGADFDSEYRAYGHSVRCLKR